MFNALGVTFFTEIFCFHVVKPLMPTLELLPTLCIYGKTLLWGVMEHECVWCVGARSGRTHMI